MEQRTVSAHIFNAVNIFIKGEENSSSTEKERRDNERIAIEETTTEKERGNDHRKRR